MLTLSVARILGSAGRGLADNSLSFGESFTSPLEAGSDLGVSRATASKLSLDGVKVSLEED